MTGTETCKTTEELFREYRETESPEIRNTIVEQHYYLAEILARKYTGRGIDYDDLFQVATYGLMLAVSRFDPDKGSHFLSYATPTVIGEIKKYFRDTMWSLKVPRRLKEISIRILEAKEALHEEFGFIPTISDLSQYLVVSEEEILEALESSLAYTTYSLEFETEDTHESEGSAYEKFLGEQEDGYALFEASDVFEAVLAKLSETEREIVQRRFLQQVTQREVAEALGISQMTVCRIEKAMRKKFRKEYNR